MDMFYTDTGAMYRSITYLALKTGCSLEDESGLVALIDTYPITFAPTETGQDVFVDGTKVTEEIRQPEVTNAVSKVSAYQKSGKTGPQQQKIAENGGVCNGRPRHWHRSLTSSGSKGFSRGECSGKKRAERRYKENQQKGITTSFDTLKKEIEQRDY